MQKSLIHELEGRKFRIARFLLNLFLIGATLAFLSYIPRLVLFPEKFTDFRSWLYWILNILILVVVFYTRFYLIRRNLKISFIIISFSLLLPAFTLMALEGTATSVPYILIIIALLSSSIVLDLRSTTYLFIFVVIIYGVIYALHSSEILHYTPITTKTDIPNSGMYLFLVWVVTHIARIGYDQIEHSYQKAFDYAKRLERLNRELDKRVKLRTKQLEESFEEKADSVHSTAVIGNITKPLLHDLATPLSSLKGIARLINRDKTVKEQLKLFTVARLAISQLERILQDGRNLMREKDQISKFSPNEVISTVAFLLKTELMKHRIKLEVNIPKRAMIKGIEVAFERIVINILLNAIEELKRCDREKRKRTIKIKGVSQGRYFLLSIKDSGRGIKKDLLDDIFDPDFSLKRGEGHIGIGLPFVKSTIEKKFGGNIKVESKVGKYTKFTLKFRKNNDQKKT